MISMKALWPSMKDQIDEGRTLFEKVKNPGCADWACWFSEEIEDILACWGFPLLRRIAEGKSYLIAREQEEQMSQAPA